MHHCPKKNGHRIIVDKESNKDGTCPMCHEKVFDINGDSSSSTAD